MIINMLRAIISFIISIRFKNMFIYINISQYEVLLLFCFTTLLLQNKESHKLHSLKDI
jgi:hypothetical protein